MPFAQITQKVFTRKKGKISSWSGVIDDTQKKYYILKYLRILYIAITNI